MQSFKNYVSFFIVGKLFLCLFFIIINFQIFPEEKKELVGDLKKAEELLNKGIIIIERNNFKEAEEIFRKSLEYAMGYNSYEAKVLNFKINNRLGEALCRSGRGGESIIPYADALLIAMELKNKEYEALAHISLARSYFMTSQYDLSLKEAHLGLKISKENNYYELSSLAAYFCGMANRDLKQFQNSMDFFEEALFYGRKAGANVSIVNALNEKGNVLYLMGNFPEALKLKLEALEFARGLGDKEAISNCLNDISIIYSQRGNHLQAENYLIESLKITEALGNERNILYSLLNLALEQSKLGKKDQAKLNFIRALKLSEKLGSLDQKKSAKKFYSEYLAEDGDFEKAYLELLGAYEIQDKMFTDELKRNISNIAYSYEIEKKQKEIELIKKEKEVEKTQKKYLVFAFFSSIFLVFLLGIVLRLKIKTNRILQEAKRREEELARIDPLTSLSNRRYAYERFKEEISKYERNGAPFSIVIFDVDQFKKINDTFGHECGDFILKNLADILKNIKRAVDAAVRWGGEEFMLILPETDIYGALKFAERLKEAISNSQLDYKGNVLRITATFGVAEYGGQIEDCLKKADDALYKGKKLGRNRVQSAGK